MVIQSDNNYGFYSCFLIKNNPISEQITNEIDSQTLGQWSLVDKTTYRFLLSTRAKLILEYIRSGNQSHTWERLCLTQFDPDSYLLKKDLTSDFMDYWTDDELSTDDSYQKTFLHGACDTKNAAFIEELVKCNGITKAVLKTLDFCKRTPLVSAIQSQDVKILKTLISYEGVTNETISNALTFSPSAAIYLDPSKNSDIPMSHRAAPMGLIGCEDEKAGILKTILESNKISEHHLRQFLPYALKNKTQFQSILESNSLREETLSSFLTENNMSTGGLPLHSLAVATNRAEIIDLLFNSVKATSTSLNTALSIQAYSQTPLQTAVNNDNVPFINACLKSEKVDAAYKILNILMEKIQKENASPFQYSAPWQLTTQRKGIDQLKEILKTEYIGYNALTARDLNDMTPAHFAFKLGGREVFELFLSSDKINADILSIQDSDNWTPLHYAASRISLSENVELSKFLLESPAVIAQGLNTPDLDGVTPLHYLFMIKNVEVIEQLLASEKVTSEGLNTPDDEGITPAGYALKSDIPEIRNALEASDKFAKEN